MPFSREITGVIIKKIPPTSLSAPPMNLDFESVSLFFWLFWWSCVSSSSISANCAYCASFSNRAAAASRSSFLLLFSSLEAHARGQKGQLSRKPSQTQQIKNWATRWETYFHSVFYITLGSTGCPSKNIYIFFFNAMKNVFFSIFNAINFQKNSLIMVLTYWTFLLYKSCKEKLLCTYCLLFLIMHA